MTAAGVYCRISQDRTGAQLGVTRQREDCLKLAAGKGWTVASEYVDNDVSASTGKRRPGYQRLLADVTAGKLGAVVVWDLDRLTRRPIEVEEFITLADSHGVALASVGGDVDLATDNGRMFARIKGAVARAEVERKGTRVRRAAVQRAEQGRYGGGTRPYGWQATERGLVLDSAEAAVVQAATRQVLAGVSLGSIARDLNDRGVLSPRGGRWSTSTVSGLLRRARNAGLSTYRGEVVGPAAWPAIVDENTWRGVVAILTDPGRKTSKGNRPAYLLSGLALCGVCGRPVTSGQVRQGRSGIGIRRIYKCRDAVHVARAIAPVDELVEAVVVARLSRQDAADLLVDDDAPDAEAMRTEARTLRVRLDSLAVDFADGSLTASQLRAATNRLRVRLAEVEAAQAHISRAPVLTGLVGATDVKADWDGLSLDRKRAVVDVLCTVTILRTGRTGRRAFDPETVRIEWRTG